HLLKPVNPAIKLRCKSDLLAKQLADATPAQPGLSGDIENTADMRRPLKFSERKPHGRMQFEPLSSVFLKLGFEHPKLLRRRARFPQPVAQSPNCGAPNQIKRNHLIVKLVRRRLKEPIAATRPKNSAHHRLDRGRLHHDILRSHSGHSSAAFREM